MVLGYSTNAFTGYSLFDAVLKIAQCGFKGLEIMGDRPHLYPQDYSDQDVAELKIFIEKHGLKITNINSFTLYAVGDTYLPSWIENDPLKREIRIEHTVDCIRLAHRLGCENISVLPGGHVSGISRAEASALFYKGLEQVIPFAEEMDVRILIEPEPGLLLENKRQFREFISNIQSDHVGLNFDIGHFFCVSEDPAGAFEELFQWIGHVHIEDIAQSRLHEHLIAGRGVINFMEIARAMKKLDYSGDICLELYPYAHMPEEAGKESLEFLLPIFEKAGLDI